jgi:hypothetical protein
MNTRRQNPEIPQRRGSASINDIRNGNDKVRGCLNLCAACRKIQIDLLRDHIQKVRIVLIESVGYRRCGNKQRAYVDSLIYDPRAMRVGPDILKGIP